jgi:hypothetical protein
MVQVGGEMKKSKLARNPRRVAGRRLMERFNNFPGESSPGRHTVATKVPDPEATRLTLAVAEGTTVEGWFEFNDGLMALYRNGDALVLFDRFVDEDYALDTVICVAAATQREVDRVMNVIDPTTSSDFEGLLLEFGND